MTRKTRIVGLSLVLVFAAVSAFAQAAGPNDWILGRWASDMKVYVTTDNFTYTNTNCPQGTGDGRDHLEFIRSGDIIEAYCARDRTMSWGFRATVSGGSIAWERRGRTVGVMTADIENNRWLPVNVSVSSDRRRLVCTQPGWQDNRQDRTITITLTKE